MTKFSTPCSTLAAMLQLILAAKFVAATISPELTLNDNGVVSEHFANGGMSGMMANDDSATDTNIGYDEKRNWQSLQGPWGKRAATWNVAAEDDDNILTEHWVPLPLLSSVDRSDALMKYAKTPIQVYFMNAATMERLMNQRQQAEEAASTSGARFNDNLLTSLEDDLEAGDNILNEKRTWKNMNVAWGKRRNAPAWNKFRGAWGKREPGWNNLKGMWGKRSSKDWQKLHAGWGKRSEMN